MWLGIFVFIGIIIAITVVFNPRFDPLKHISNNLLDTNITRVIRPTAGLGAILLSRIFAFAVIFSIVFLVCLHRWTICLVFPLAAYQGFSLFINLYWTITRFGVATGTVLFLVYFFLLLALLFIIFVAMVFCMRTCEPVRKGGFRGGIHWNKFGYRCLKIFIVVACFALVEWLMYWLILSKFAFVV